jgi:hypothetical protein
VLDFGFVQGGNITYNVTVVPEPAGSMGLVVSLVTLLPLVWRRA